MFSQLYSAWRLVRKHKICLVHAHWVIPQGVVARLLKAICPDVIIVVTSHGGDVYGLNGRFLEYLKSNVYNASKVVTVVSMAMADYLRAVLKDSDIRIAPMGVDLRERFVQKQSLDGRRGIIFVGRLVEKKGVGILLDAFSRVLGDYPQVKLTIIGEGPARTALRQKLAALHIEESVHFLGAVPNSEIPELLNQHAIAVVPSVVAANGDQEGLGLVAIEAMGCACAVIASDLPALRDVVDHNINGLLFEVGNANALATCIRQLVEDEDLRCRLAESGRESVLHKFDWNEATERYRKIFSTLN
jgi:glycosyltransferase involved in cell wall biosynthesis